MPLACPNCRSGDTRAGGANWHCPSCGTYFDPPAATPPAPEPEKKQSPFRKSK